jgi:hypothetical protein
MPGIRAPDRVIMVISGLRAEDAKWLAILATGYARSHAPKLSGDSARRIVPLYGRDHFGMRWSDDRVWFQNSGVRPFLMRSLAGKTIPMWIDDPTGTERNKNPKAKVRVTESGRVQVLIFRRAAQTGTYKMVEKRRRLHGKMQTVSTPVPRSFPGAPGRIATRQARSPYATPSQSTGQIAKRNVGIRWYFPGLTPRNFLQNGLVEACNRSRIIPGAIHIGYGFTPIPGSSNIISAYPSQPLAEMVSALAKRGVRSTSFN